MKLSRSTYYYQSKNKAVDDSELIALIEAIIEEFSGYGYRRVTRELPSCKSQESVAHHAGT